MTSADRYTRYQICIEGRIEQRWLRWFEGLEVKANADDQTVISGELDQSGLHGLFNRIRDLGLELVSVHQLPSDGDVHSTRKAADKEIQNQENDGL